MAATSVGTITYIKPGHGDWPAMLTMSFVDDKGRSQEQDFACNPVGALSLDVGDQLDIVKMPLVPVWVIADEKLGHRG